MKQHKNWKQPVGATATKILGCWADRPAPDFLSPAMPQHALESSHLPLTSTAVWRVALKTVSAVVNGLSITVNVKGDWLL